MQNFLSDPEKNAKFLQTKETLKTIGMKIYPDRTQQIGKTYVHSPCINLLDPEYLGFVDGKNCLQKLNSSTDVPLAISSFHSIIGLYN